jgi:chemotaxis response regulator CheB
MKVAIASHVDSMREALCALVEARASPREQNLAEGSKHQLLWTASTSEQALRKCAQQTPDVLLLDLALPSVGGVEITRQIMHSAPCAVLVVTTRIEADSGRVFQAMGEGALDVVELPVLTKPGSQHHELLLRKLDVVKQLLGIPRSRPSVVAPLSASRDEGLLAIGASAGGPAALAKLLADLPTSFPFAVVIVQHIDAQFAAGMAGWLGQQSAWPVRVAQEGDRPVCGAALLAGTADHLVFKSSERLGYTAQPVDYPYRPSIDTFFYSVSRYWQNEAIGVLLTGMGKDGALGLKELRDKGRHTIAQDEQSSAVYGMPKAAAALRAAVDILSLADIAPRLQKLASFKRGTTNGDAT